MSINFNKLIIAKPSTDISLLYVIIGEYNI